MGRSLILLMFWLATSCSGQDFTVAAASSLRDAVDSLRKEFKRETGSDFRIVTASSGTLTNQIVRGAPYSIFFAADMHYPGVVARQGYAIDTPRTFAEGRLVLWTKDSLPSPGGMAILLDRKIRRIAIANPETAPYGKAAMEALQFYKIDDAVREKFVTGESIAQVNHFIASRSVDAGFTSLSSVLVPDGITAGHWIEIDTASYVSLRHGALILRYGADHFSKECNDLFRILFSAQGRAILDCFGYHLP